MTIRNLDRLFGPASVAVIGASAKAGSLGKLIVQNLQKFRGAVYAVNPRGGVIEGRTVYTSVSALPQIPDLAIVVTPPGAVASVVAELGAAGCRAGIILTAGFGEGEDAEGARRRQEVLTAARPYLFRIIGPNCLGVLVPSLGLNASFARTPANPGNVALIAQSGAVASALLDWARPRGIGFSHVVTLGDMIDVDFGDMLDYLCDDTGTQAILLYVEGITHARKFMSAARRAARTKPVLVVKAGRTAASAKIAASHTGALAGSDAVYNAVFARAGLMRVDDLDDLFLAAELLAAGGPLKGDRLAIITNGGGLGLLAADCLLADQGRLAELSSATRLQLDSALPVTWSRANPVDIIGDASADRYRIALDAMLTDAGVDAALAIHCPTAVVDPQAIATIVADVSARRPEKLVLTAWVGEESVASARAVFSQRRIPTFATPRSAVKGFMQLVNYRRLQDTLLESPSAIRETGAHATAEARAILSQGGGARWLPPVQARQILELYGIPCNRAAHAPTPLAAGLLARKWACRVALKIVSPDIVHKSDVGGVILDVEPDAAEHEARNLLAAVHAARPEARLDGVLVEEMIKRPGGHELFLGMTADPTFGAIIAFGHGGTGIEVIDDKTFGLPPLNGNLATAMIEATRVGKLLAGYRNRPKAHVEGIVRALVSLSQLVADHPQVIDLDINPLLADEHGIIAVDARIKVDPTVTVSSLIITPYPRDLERLLPRQNEPPIFARPVKPQDTALLREFAKKLSPEDVRFRFFIPLHDVASGFAARLSQIDYDREMVLIACPATNSAEIIALAYFNADPDNVGAEFAIAVRSDQQGHGVGFALLQYLLEVAQQRGLTTIWGDVLAGNARMLHLARSLGMRELPCSHPGIVRMQSTLNGR
jgi:acetyltransferase